LYGANRSGAQQSIHDFYKKGCQREGMAKGDKVSKTNVSARAEEKAQAAICPDCGQKVRVALVVNEQGKRRMTRLCCLEG